MNVPVVTLETPPAHAPSWPGIPSPHTLTWDGISLKSTPPGWQIVAVSPEAIVVVTGSTVQTGTSPSMAPEGAPAVGQTPATGSGWSSNVGQEGDVGGRLTGAIGRGSAVPGTQEHTCSAPQTPFVPGAQEALQSTPQAPQLYGSEPSATHRLSHAVWPSPHVMHAPS